MLLVGCLSLSCLRGLFASEPVLQIICRAMPAILHLQRGGHASGLVLRAC